MVSEQPDGLRVREFIAGEPHGIAKRRALHDLALSFVVPGQSHTHRQIGAASDEQLGHGEAVVAELRDRMEDGRVSADTGLVDRGTGVDVGTTVEKQRCRRRSTVLGGHV